MKRLFAIIILISLLFQNMAHYSVIALFELNKDYIARNLCENRYKPEKKCCGKCYLKKKLKTVEESNEHSGNGPIKTEKQELTSFVLPGTVQPVLQPIQSPAKNYNPVQQHMNGYHPATGIFHPPSYTA